VASAFMAHERPQILARLVWAPLFLGRPTNENAYIDRDGQHVTVQAMLADVDRTKGDSAGSCSQTVGSHVCGLTGRQRLETKA